MEEIIEKANYCLNCKVKPCSNKGCPLHNEIPDFIKEVKEENFSRAYEILCKTTVLQGVCGRICPHMKQCQGSCVRGIKGEPVAIGDLEAVVFDKAMEEGNSLVKVWKEEIEENRKVLRLGNKKVAVIGGGPAGITAAAFLTKAGVNVTIYEKYNFLGGLLMYGIPEFRLDKKIVEKTVKNILDLGIKVEYGKELGKNLSLNELEKEYDAIFLSFVSTLYIGINFSVVAAVSIVSNLSTPRSAAPPKSTNTVINAIIYEYIFCLLNTINIKKPPPKKLFNFMLVLGSL